MFRYQYKLAQNAAKAKHNINQVFEENVVNNRKVQR